MQIGRSIQDFLLAQPGHPKLHVTLLVQMTLLAVFISYILEVAMLGFQPYLPVSLLYIIAVFAMSWAALCGIGAFVVVLFYLFFHPKEQREWVVIHAAMSGVSLGVAEAFILSGLVDLWFHKPMMAMPWWMQGGLCFFFIAVGIYKHNTARRAAIKLVNWNDSLSCEEEI